MHEIFSDREVLVLYSLSSSVEVLMSVCGSDMGARCDQNTYDAHNSRFEVREKESICLELIESTKPPMNVHKRWCSFMHL